MFSRSQALTSKHFFTLINPRENGLVFLYKGQGCDIMGAAGGVECWRDGEMAGLKREMGKAKDRTQVLEKEALAALSRS